VEHTTIVEASTGVRVAIACEDELFHVTRLDAPWHKAEVCQSLDLFEVIAELAGLDLEHGADAAEAMHLADQARGTLWIAPHAADSGDGDAESAGGSPAS
jgi:hypothetical protein